MAGRATNQNLLSGELGVADVRYAEALVAERMRTREIVSAYRRKTTVDKKEWKHNSRSAV